MELTELIGLAAGTILMLQSLPQVLRVRALGHGRGVSLVSWVMQGVMFASWLAYGLSTGSPSVAFTNLVSAGLAVSVILHIVEAPARWIGLMAVLFAAAFAFVFTAPESLITGYLIALMSSALPQVRASFLNFSHARASAVSVRGLLVGCGGLLLWETYAVLEHRTVILITTTLALALNVTIASLETAAARRHARVAPVQL